MTFIKRFEVGDKVICVNATNQRSYLKVGKVYRVVGYNEPTLRGLSGHEEVYLDGIGGSFREFRFIKLDCEIMEILFEVDYET